MKKICAYLLAATALMVSGAASVGSIFWIFDEPKSSFLED